VLLSAWAIRRRSSDSTRPVIGARAGIEPADRLLREHPGLAADRLPAGTTDDEAGLGEAGLPLALAGRRRGRRSRRPRSRARHRPRSRRAGLALGWLASPSTARGASDGKVPDAGAPAKHEQDGGSGGQGGSHGPRYAASRARRNGLARSALRDAAAQ
jgi:hypothetical protein